MTSSSTLITILNENLDETESGSIYHPPFLFVNVVFPNKIVSSLFCLNMKKKKKPNPPFIPEIFQYKKTII